MFIIHSYLNALSLLSSTKEESEWGGSGHLCPVAYPKIHLLDGLELTCFQDGRIIKL